MAHNDTFSQASRTSSKSSKYSHVKSKIDTGLSGYSAARSRVSNGVRHPKAAGTRAPFHDKAHKALPTLDQVGVVINTEQTRNLNKDLDTTYKQNFTKKGYTGHLATQKQQEQPIKIYAPEKTPVGNPRFPWKAYRKLTNTLTF
jgi:hypothetical protein